MSIFAYGFGPYGKHATNITDKIIYRLKPRQNLATKVFAVRFDEKQFLQILGESKYQVVLGLGQCVSGNRIRIEKQAVNLRRNNRYASTELINQNSPQTLPATIDIEPTEQTVLSFNAGTGVCNFSMYVYLHALLNKQIKFGFLHIPEDYDLTKAVNFIENTINKIDV